MWKPEHRQAADRSGLRYPSDLTDAEWVIVEPMIPPGPAWRTQTLGERARGAERDLLYPVDRMPMEGVAKRSAPEKYSARLSRTVELGLYIGAHPSCTLRRGARAGRT